MLVGGIGTRIAVTPTLLVRAEAVFQPNRGTSVDRSDPLAIDTIDVKFTNYGINLGVSLMLGSKPVPDSDGDGILNNRDRCAGTPAGAQVDGRGCPADTDGDGVPNGVDRCPNTAVGALVDAAGCTHDSDGDNIADGIDKCPDTPTGVLVDSNGCPKDSDGDSIADGLDRCSDTPMGATVDALGCPGDEDADGVLDGLDRCPRTPTGANVNSSGCVQGQGNRQPAAAPPAAPPAVAPAPTPRPRGSPDGRCHGPGERDLRDRERPAPSRVIRGARLDREGADSQPSAPRRDRWPHRSYRFARRRHASLDPPGRSGAELPGGAWSSLPASRGTRIRRNPAAHTRHNTQGARGQQAHRAAAAALTGRLDQPAGAGISETEPSPQEFQ